MSVNTVALYDANEGDHQNPGRTRSGEILDGIISEEPEHAQYGESGVMWLR